MYPLAKNKSLRQIVLCSHLFFVLLYEKKTMTKRQWKTGCVQLLLW